MTKEERYIYMYCRAPKKVGQKVRKYLADNKISADTVHKETKIDKDRLRFFYRNGWMSVALMARMLVYIASLEGAKA